MQIRTLDDATRIHDYHDSQGAIVYRVARFDNPKEFRPFHEENGEWRQGLGGVGRVLYQLPRVLAAKAAGQVIYFTEGERDADSIIEQGQCGTTKFGGATSPMLPDYLETLRDADVIVVRDRDPAGIRGAAATASDLRPYARSVRAVEPRVGKDVTEHLLAGRLLDELVDVGDRVITRGWYDGDAFVLDGRPDLNALWGSGQQVLWSAGESLLLAGPQGAGKTTLVQQLVLARIGLRDGLLGLPVAPCRGKVAYLALDRPSQIARSFARMVTLDARPALSAGLVVWSGPLEFDPLGDPMRLVQLLRDAGATDVVIDSLKDVAPGLANDEVGSALNKMRQILIVEGFEVVEVNHLRKPQRDNKRPNSLGDVYGSVWITAGAGSVVLLLGEAGSPLIELRHVKQPAEEVGPLRVLHDHVSGLSTSSDQIDLLALVGSLGREFTANEAAALMFETDKPSRRQVETARRRLNSWQINNELVSREEPTGRGGRNTRLWRVVDTTAGNVTTVPRANHAAIPVVPRDQSPQPRHRSDKQTRTDHATTPANHASGGTISPPGDRPVAENSHFTASVDGGCTACKNDPICYEAYTGRPLCADHAPDDVFRPDDS